MREVRCDECGECFTLSVRHLRDRDTGLVVRSEVRLAQGASVSGDRRGLRDEVASRSREVCIPASFGSIRVTEMPIYRLHAEAGDLGFFEHPAPNLEAGDVLVLADGSEALVTARVEAEPGPGPLVAVLEVALSPRPAASLPQTET